MAKYTLTNKAVEDLSNIWNYTYEVWSEEQADKYYLMIIDCCDLLSKQPEKGKNYDEIHQGLLGMKVGKHVIFYQTCKLGEIEVIRILHERMDLKNRLQD